MDEQPQTELSVLQEELSSLKLEEYRASQTSRAPLKEPKAMIFCTLGMFIIDDIYFPPPTPAALNVLGGAGTYAAFGARLFSPPPQSEFVGWIVDAGSDFPDEIRRTIETWETGCVLRQSRERLTTRGWNSYASDLRAFKYLTPKLRLNHDSLPNTHLFARVFHLICSPKRCMELVENIERRRVQLDPAAARPLFVWEPVPDFCTPEELSNTREAVEHIDIFSPNHDELARLWGVQATNAATGEVDFAWVALASQYFYSFGLQYGKGGAVVVRAGKIGCCITGEGQQRWLPAYHGTRPEITGVGRVVDPTGAGNAFLGALAVSLARESSMPVYRQLEVAATWGTIAASFAIEQVGVPNLGKSDFSILTETWNGESADGRVDRYMRILETYEQPV